MLTSVGVLSFGEADALAFSVVPEPSTWALLLLGVGMGIVTWWRRSRADAA